MKISRNRYSSQFVGLTLTNAYHIVLGIVSSLFLTYNLTVEDYGLYKFIINIYTTVSVFIQLGISYASSVLLTTVESKLLERKIITYSTVLMTGISFITSLVIIIFSSFIISDSIEKIVIISAIPFLYTIVLQTSYIETLKGANEVKSVAIQTVAPQTLFLVLLFFAYLLFSQKLNYTITIIAHTVAYTFIHIYTFKLYYSPIGSEKESIQTMLSSRWKQTGLKVYIGSLFGVASSLLLNTYVGHREGMRIFGMFSLALAIASPMQVIPSTMGTVLFKRNAKSNKLSNKNLALTFALSISALLVYIFAINNIFPAIFPESYDGSFELAKILSLSLTIYGLGDYFNRFVGAHGYGNYIRNSATLTGLFNLLVSIFLMTFLGVWGVVYGRLFSGIVYLFSMIGSYILVVREKSKEA